MNSNRISHIQVLKSLLEKEEQQYEFVKRKSKELYSNFSDSDKTFLDVFTYLKVEDLEYCYYRSLDHSFNPEFLRLHKEGDLFVKYHNNLIDVLRTSIKEGWDGFSDWVEDQGVFVNRYKIFSKDMVHLSRFALEFVHLVSYTAKYRKHVIEIIKNEISFLERFERKRKYIEELEKNDI